jgi:hypothetical protein
LLLLAGSPARADLIAWGEYWSVGPHVVWAKGPGNSRLVLSGEEAQHQMLGSSEVVAANVRAFSDAPATRPQTLAAPFSLILFIRDKATGLLGALTFTGTFNGTLSSKSAAVTLNPTSPASQTLHLGHHLYKVSLDQFSPPGPPGSHSAGAISAHVAVQNNPEPSSLILAALGVPLLGIPLYRGRKRGRGMVTPRP